MVDEELRSFRPGKVSHAFLGLVGLLTFIQITAITNSAQAAKEIAKNQAVEISKNLSDLRTALKQSKDAFTQVGELDLKSVKRRLCCGSNRYNFLYPTPLYCDVLSPWFADREKFCEKTTF